MAVISHGRACPVCNSLVACIGDSADPKLYGTCAIDGTQVVFYNTAVVSSAAEADAMEATAKAAAEVEAADVAEVPAPSAPPAGP